MKTLHELVDYLHILISNWFISILPNDVFVWDTLYVSFLLLFAISCKKGLAHTHYDFFGMGGI